MDKDEKFEERSLVDKPPLYERGKYSPVNKFVEETIKELRASELRIDAPEFVPSNSTSTPEVKKIGKGNNSRLC